MPKILITGNGFDLNFNLPTTYLDFIKILNFIETNDNYSFDSIYSNSINYKQIKSCFDNEIGFDSERIKLLKENIKENLWFQFFKEELNIETWIDFENKVNYVLKLLLKSITVLNSNFFSKTPLALQLGVYNSSSLDNNIEIIKVLSFFKIISKKSPSFAWSFIGDYLINKYDYYISLDIQKIVTLLNKQLIEFKKIFNEYFSLFIIPLYENNKIEYDSKILSSINYYFTFNYTPTFEKLFNSHTRSNYLHGKINSDTNSIVLGVNDVPTDIEDKIHFLPFTKYYQKLNNNTDFYFLDEIEGITKNSSLTNFEFYFWGHSLDRSDEDYINEIFDFVSNSKSKKTSINVIYHSEQTKSKLILNLLDIRGKIDIVNKMRKKELIFYKSDSEELKKALNKDISSRMYAPTAF